METEMKAVGIREAVKDGLSMIKMEMKELAARTGKDISSVSSTLSRGKPNLNNVLEMMEVLGAKVIVRYDGGSEVELKRNK